MKKILSLLLSALLLLSAVGCGAVVEPAQDETGDASIPVIVDGLTNTARVEGDESEEKEDLTLADNYAKVIATEDAFVRGGSYGNQSMHETKLQGTMHLSGAGGNYTRKILLKFNLAELDLTNKKTVYLRVDFIDGGTNNDGKQIYVSAYAIGTDWKSTTVTYNSMPAYSESDLVGTALSIKSGVAQIDVTDYILDAKADGKTEVAFVLEQTGATSRSQATAVSVDATNPDFAKREKPTLLAVETTKNYTEKLLADGEQNKAVWEYAQKLYDEWYARYQEILKKGDYKTEMIRSNPDDYSVTVNVKTSPSGSATATPTRIMDTLSGYEEKEYETDVYGGIISEKLKFEATGRFYTKQVDGRWWLVTPLGNPCIIRGLNAFNYAYQGNSPYQTDAMYRVYGSPEKWAIAATRWVSHDLGFNVAAGGAEESWQVVNPLAQTVRYGYEGMATYARMQDVIYKSSPFVMRYNDTMPVFDPAFETYIDGVAKKTVEAYGDRLSHVLGYTSDNELPVTDDMLIGYLTIDPSIPANLYSYALAWTWYKNMTGEENPSVLDVHKHSERLDIDLLDLFKGCVYDRYYCVFATAYDKYDPEGLFLGVRSYISCDRWEWLARFSGYWCDTMCINYYHAWEIDEQNLYDLARWSGVPLFITEFYSKGEDAIAADGKPFANTHGAGFVVPTQTDKGYFYQNFCLRLLENKYSIGWLYFQYIDNNPLDADIHPAASNSNKGIVTSDHDTEAYHDLTKYMAQLNKNVYSLIEFFDGESYFD